MFFIDTLPEDIGTPERCDQGLVVVLPGIEGYSYCNRSVVRGLLAGNVPYALEIFDWTTGYRGLGIYHLRSTQLQQRSAERLISRIADYQEEYPDRPVYLVGHSGGGAMSMRTLSQLARPISGAILLGAAVSPWYNPIPALKNTARGAWNFTSWGDLFFLGLATTLVGTVDGWHAPAAGMVGFSSRVHQSVREAAVPPLREMPYCWSYSRHSNLGGHFGYTSAAFTAEIIAPLLQEALPE